MDRLDWNQARQYWRDDRRRAGETDQVSDPDALGNVCHVGAPFWFNEYYARHQRRVFNDLLLQVPSSPGSRALDVGCGAGRWCRLLAEHGYSVTGIDLQERLIERDRMRYPQMTFECTAIQDFVAEPFDLVTSVTVIQHIPFDEQRSAVSKIGSIVRSGGYLLILENVSDQGPHVFANSINQWTRLFEDVGFSRLELKRYDYSPAIRLSSALVGIAGNLARRLGLMAVPEGAPVPRAPTADGGTEGGALRRAVRRAGWALRRPAVMIDDRLEPALISLDIKIPTVHCGFLFQKTV
jgi:SAM-dependent methyltransferase